MPEEQQNAETKAMLDTCGKQVDFVDLCTLEPIIETIKSSEAIELVQAYRVDNCDN